MLALFKNDNHVRISLPEHEKSHTFKTRDNHEVLFRRIITWLINNRFITKNIVDSGAWIGDNAIPWAKNIQGIVYAIDPSKSNCNFIHRVCELNNITNIKLFETALSNTEEILKTDETLDHCTFIHGGSTEVNSTTLNKLLYTNEITDIDFVHLDVEGMEFKVIQGMSDIIEKYQPIIAFEQHLNEDNILEITTYIKSKNYTVYMINETLPGCKLDCRNFLALPNNFIYEEAMRDIRIYFSMPVLFTRF